MEIVLKQLVKELKEMKQGISQLSQTMATKDDLHRVNDTMEENLKHVQDAMKNDITQIHTTMATKEQLQLVEQAIENLSINHKKDVITILKKMDHRIREVSSRVNQLSIIQSRQHRVIELLSARSVEHEAKLKRKR